MRNQILLVVCLATPFAVALLTALCHRTQTLRDTASLAAPFVSLAAVLMLTVAWSPGSAPELQLTRIAGDVGIGFKVEPLGLVFALLVSLLWPVSALYSLAYLYQNQLRNITSFLVYYNLAIGGAFGIAFAENLLTLFIFYEILTLATWPLVTHDRSREALAAGRFYLGTLIGTSTLFLLTALVWIWSATDTLSFTPGGILQGRIEPAHAGWLLLLVVLGTAKAAIMPFHRWLPRAMVAPVPVSALLHAVAVVKAGTFTIVKTILYVFGLDFLEGAGGSDWLVYLAGFTMVAASVIALRQNSLKKLLAYSTVGQLSYIILGAALLKSVALSGAMLHMLAHGFGKITLFFAAGAIYTASGKTRLDQMKGIGRVMPWTMGLFAVAVISLIGLPPLAGFSSKWLLLQGAADSGWYFATAALVLSTLLNAAYFIPIVYRAFSAGGGAEPATHGEAPAAMIIAMTVPVLLALALFFGIDSVVQLIGDAL